MLDMKAIQRRLNELGFDAGVEDGIKGPQTERAIRAFKRSIGFRDRSWIGPKTYQRLMGKPLPKINEPAWMVEARSKIGLREIRGPRHNNFIAKGWARLGAPWFNNDETPWCGFFVAHCIDKAGLPFPGRGMFARALSWRKWGVKCEPLPGAIASCKRKGGGHVGFLVGESERNYYILGGNQRNMVNIMPLSKDRDFQFRWPKGEPIPNTPLPQMSGGVVSRNEA